MYKIRQRPNLYRNAAAQPIAVDVSARMDEV